MTRAGLLLSAVAVLELAVVVGLLYGDQRRDWMDRELRRLTEPLPAARTRLSDLPGRPIAWVADAGPPLAIEGPPLDVVERVHRGLLALEAAPVPPPSRAHNGPRHLLIEGDRQ